MPSSPVSEPPLPDGLTATPAAPVRPLVSFWAPCEPPTTTAQQKGVFIVNGVPRFFTKKKVKKAATLLSWVFKRYRPVQPLDQPLSVHVRVVYPHLKSTPKKLKGTTQPHICVNPDVDNAYKLIGDVLTDLGFWRDDGLVYDLHVSKWRGPNPGIGVKILPYAWSPSDEASWSI